MHPCQQAASLVEPSPLSPIFRHAAARDFAPNFMAASPIGTDDARRHAFYAPLPTAVAAIDGRYAMITLITPYQLLRREQSTAILRHRPMIHGLPMTTGNVEAELPKCTATSARRASAQHIGKMPFNAADIDSIYCPSVSTPIAPAFDDYCRAPHLRPACGAGICPAGQLDDSSD